MKKLRSSISKGEAVIRGLIKIIPNFLHDKIFKTKPSSLVILHLHLSHQLDASLEGSSKSRKNSSNMLQ